MNIRKNIDYSAMFAAMDTAMATGMSQMELYCQLALWSVNDRKRVPLSPLPNI